MWELLTAAYETADAEEADCLLTRVTAVGSAEIAKALAESSKIWWLSRVRNKVYIEPGASMVSGEGWSLYEEKPAWFADIMAQLRKAASVAKTGSA